MSQYGHLDSRQIQAKEIKAIQDGFKDGLRSPIDLSDSHRPTFQKAEKVYSEIVTPEERKPAPLIQKDSFENYIIHLHFENSILINEIGYPADWDLVGNYTDQKTKDFIQMAVKNPALIRFREKFDLS